MRIQFSHPPVPNLTMTTPSWRTTKSVGMFQPIQTGSTSRKSFNLTILIKILNRLDWALPRLTMRRVPLSWAHWLAIACYSKWMRPHPWSWCRGRKVALLPSTLLAKRAVSILIQVPSSFAVAFLWSRIPEPDSEWSCPRQSCTNQFRRFPISHLRFHELGSSDLYRQPDSIHLKMSKANQRRCEQTTNSSDQSSIASILSSILSQHPS